MFQYVPSKGSLNSKIVLVGEQPGQIEVERGEPFVGPSGDNLDECLIAAGLHRSQCYLTNVIKDLNHPLEYYIKIPINKDYSINISSDGQKHIERLAIELEMSTANIIVPMGNVALFVLTGRRGIFDWRGSVIESTLLPGRKVMPTIHPAIYTQEKLFEKPTLYMNRYLITNDLKHAKQEMEYPEIKGPSYNIIIQPNYYEVLEFLSECYLYSRTAPVFWDIEITPGTQELSCISFSLGDKKCMCIPFDGPNHKHMFTIEEEDNIILSIARILEDPLCYKAGQNVIFDSHFLLNRYGIKTKNLRDTMINQQILYPELPKSLAFINSFWNQDIPFYKREGKIWVTGQGTYEQGWMYNALDSVSCARAYPKQVDEIKEKHNWDTLERQTRLIEPLTYMMEKGIKIDIPGMIKEATNLADESNELQDQLAKQVGFNLNPESHKQVVMYFYDIKGLDPYYNKTGGVTVDKKALAGIANKGHEEARTILAIRAKRKLISTYLDTTKIDDDGRMRCSYNPVGTKFSRISSSESIFGKGINMQNIPHDLLQYFLIDDGYVGYSCDMSQIEARIVAYVGQIDPMIEVFENGQDIHRLTGSLIFSKPYNEVNDKPSKKKGTIDEHTSERDLAKRANHGFNYGFGYKKFALMHEMSERESRFLHRSYHNAYPGVQHGYWKYVQDQLKVNRTLTNLMGRKTLLLGKWGDDLFHIAYSCIPQGTCGDLINEYGLLYVYYSDDPALSAVELITQTHDSIDFQIPLSAGIDYHVKALNKIVSSLEVELEFKGRKFILPTELVVKRTLRKEDGYKLSTVTNNTLHEAWERLGYANTNCTSV